ncbi:hypothetical protein JW711_02585 [Candidatus Woesearchaeota archaeon]|nr:hypothetical protein [Candidatus Woesearchaeota archaeon]
MARGQIALEFVFILIMILVVVTSFAWTAYYLYAGYSEEDVQTGMQDLGYSLQNEVILASVVEPGYQRNITVPEEVKGAAVNISGTENEIIISYKGDDMLFLIPNVTGSFATGYNLLKKNADGTLTIE